MKRSLAAILVSLIGFALLVAGAAVIYWPAGLLLAGVLLITAGMFAVDVG